MRKWWLALLLSVAVAAQGRLAWQRENLKLALELDSHQGEAARLLMLDPTPSAERPGFHGYPIVKTLTLNRSQTSRLLQTLTRSLRQSQGQAAATFRPRYGLSFSKLDVVVSFQSSRVLAFPGGRPWQGRLLGGEETFQNSFSP